MIPPSLSPTITSQSFRVSLSKRLRGTLVRLIFWKVWYKIKRYHSFHVVSEVNVLALLADGEVGLIEDFADDKADAFLLVTGAVALSQKGFLFDVEIVRMGLIDIQQRVAHVELVNIISGNDTEIWWYNDEVFLWVDVSLLDRVSEFKHFDGLDGFLFALLDWN